MRRLLLFLGLLAAGFVLLVGTVPWWLGLALHAGARPFGTSFADYERLGYRQFRLRDVTVHRPGVEVHVDLITAETPLVWLWHRWRRRPSAVRAGAWRVNVEPGKTAPRARGPSGWRPLQAQLAKIGDRLDYWLPEAETGPGEVAWKGQRLGFGPARWRERTLSVPKIGYNRWTAEAALALAPGGEMRLTARSRDEDLRVDLRADRASVAGQVTAWGQPAELAAEFEPEGWRPRVASLRAETWQVPGDKLRLGNAYSQLHGGGRADWRNGELTTELSIEGEPVAGSHVPPLAIALRGHLERGVAVVQQLNVKLPGVTAQLEQPVAVDRQGLLRSGASRFGFAVELARQPWLSAKGSLRGDGVISADEKRRAVVAFSLSGEKLTAGQLALTRLEAAGRLAWPDLQLEHGRLETPDGSELVVDGGWNFRTREIVSASAKGRVQAALVTRWLPRGVNFKTAAVDLTAAGPWRTAAHGGRVVFDGLVMPGTRMLAASLTWHGAGETVEQFEAEVKAGGTAVHARGAVNRERLQLDALRLLNGETTRLALVRPATLRWAGGLALDGLQAAGPEAELNAAFRWAEDGAVALAARHLVADWLRELVVLPGPSWSLDRIAVNGKWSRGPADYTIDSAVTVQLGGERSAQLATQLHGTAAGLEIGGLRIAEGAGEIVNATGRLPLVVQPGQRPSWRFDAQTRWNLNVVTTRNPEFWAKLATLTGVEVVDPDGRVQLAGTPAAPRGEVDFRAARMAPVPGRFDWQWPKIEQLDAHVVGDAGRLRLDRFSVRVAGQLVTADGTIAIPEENWREAWSDPRELARRGDLHVAVPDADIAAIAQFFPEYLATKGRLRADLTFNTDQGIRGEVQVQDAASRPLGPLGVLQEVNADLRFEGRAVTLRKVDARMGGEAVVLRGQVALPAHASPRFDLTLRGENLPFVRQAGLLVRGDLDLRLQSEEAGRATIAGDVRLRDSLFLTDIRSFLPSGAKGGASRPPYFAIDTPPLDRWRLNVAVHGEKFMQLRTPVFNGTASMRVALAGTLGNPRATGQATIDEGTVRLPFASLDVQQGEVRLTPEQVEPQLWVAATTRRYGYDLRMELTGPVSAPNLTFTSSPPLAAEQVLLMVMAGEAPRNEVTTTDRQRVARFGAFFGQSLLGTLGGDGGGADRLTISSGENISEQGRETYSIEYRLNDKWSLTGEYDEFDEYYGGLKWRFYEKGGKRRDAQP